MQFRLPDQIPVSWGRVEQSGEGGTNAIRIDGSGLNNYNYLMHTMLLAAPSDVSLQTRLRAKFINMNVDNPAFEGAAVLHRGFKMSGSEPNLEIDTQVWSSNPAAGGRKSWISGDDSNFKTYNFVIPLPEVEGMDYVTWELVVRANGQIIVEDVQCRHFYGKPYDLDIIGSQDYFGNQMSLETFQGVTRWVKYLKIGDMICQKGQLMIVDSSGALRASAVNQDLADIPVTTGFMLKLRRTGTGVEDSLDTSAAYSTTIRMGVYPLYDETRQRRARYNYDRYQLLAYIEPHRRSTDSSWGPDTIGFINPKMDLFIADFVGPSQ